MFCFAHLAYIMRVVMGQVGSLNTWTMQNDMRCKLSHVKITVSLVLVLLAVIALAFILLDSIFVVTFLYAILFITNIYVSARYLQHNRKLAITGLLLFAACDICVLLFNLPIYMGAPEWLRGVFPLIWVFYLPSQVLLAISAINFSRKK